MSYWIVGLDGEPGSDARRKLTLATSECARTALPMVPAAASASAAYAALLAKCADIVRKHYPQPPEIIND